MGIKKPIMGFMGVVMGTMAFRLPSFKNKNKNKNIYFFLF
jgi:hypothetical protein